MDEKPERTEPEYGASVVPNATLAPGTKLVPVRVSVCAAEPATPRLKTGLRAGARDGRIFDADSAEDLPGEPL